MATVSISQKTNAGAYVEQRAMLAASLRWTARLNFHEGVANHFSLAVNESGTDFLLNPDQRHFSQIRASDLLLLNVHDESWVLLFLFKSPTMVYFFLSSFFFDTVVGFVFPF